MGLIWKKYLTDTRSVVVNASVMKADWHKDGASLECLPPLHEESFKQRLNRYRPKKAGIMGGQLLIEKFTEV
jgi:hypothetical protein